MSDSQPTRDETAPSQERAPWMRPQDQASLLGLFASILLMMTASWLYHGGHRGQLIDIDRAEPLTAPYLVDINRADWPEMIQLPGLGETLARRIVTDRMTHGEFRSVDELQRIDGIGRRTLERLRPYLLPIPQDTDWAAQ